MGAECYLLVHLHKRKRVYLSIGYIHLLVKGISSIPRLAALLLQAHCKEMLLYLALFECYCTVKLGFLHLSVGEAYFLEVSTAKLGMPKIFAELHRVPVARE